MKDIEENGGLLEKPFLQPNGKGKYIGIIYWSF
jgi:hypothetical protein